MRNRIGWSATAAVSISAGLVLAIYQVMEWKMPDFIAYVLIAITSLAGFIAVIVLCHAVWIWSRPIRKRYALRFPIYRQDKPNPLQWLIDIAEQQEHNPTTHLVVIDRIVLASYLDKKLPYVRIRVCFANFGVNEVSIAQPEGYPYFGNNRLPCELKDTGGRYNVPPGNTATSFDLDIYFPPELVEDVRKEVDAPSGEMRSLSLSQVSAKVQAKGEDAPTVEWQFATGREVFRPNRANPLSSI